MASGQSDLCAVLQLEMHTDIVRVALAKLALSFASRDDDTCETQVGAPDACSAAINVFKAAANFDAASAFNKCVADASVWFRTLRGKAYAGWIESLELLTKDVLQCIPEYWQIFTLESKGNENILEHIVNNDALSHIMSHCDSLKNARDTMGDALPRLMLDESEPPLKFDAKLEERMDTLYNYG
ncbi:hypothetical protein N9L68_06775 [bacterium]|nr:hypothetical protein [bacterium]